MFTMAEISTLRRAGFIPREINEFQWAVSENGKPYVTDLESPVWRDVIRHRKEMIAKLDEQGWSRAEIAAGIERFYTMRGKFSPFDWLKIEYRPLKRVHYKEVQKRNVRRRVRYRMKKMFGEHEVIVKQKVRRNRIKKTAQTRQQKAVMRYLREISG